MQRSIDGHSHFLQCRRPILSPGLIKKGKVNIKKIIINRYCKVFVTLATVSLWRAYCYLLA